jgi:hypothetical protein
LTGGCSTTIALHHRTGRGNFLHLDLGEPRHVEVLSPEVDRLLVGAHEIVGHLLQRRRAESVHAVLQALDPGDDQQRPVFDVVVGVVVRDENRFERVEWNAGARVIVGDAHAAIDHVGCAVTQHHMRGHLPRAAGPRAGGGAEQHQLGALGVFECVFRLLRRPARAGALRGGGNRGGESRRAPAANCGGFVFTFPTSLGPTNACPLQLILCCADSARRRVRA